MDEYKNFRVLRQVSEGTQTIHVVLKVRLEFFRSHVEDKDQDANVLENMISLRLEVLLHESILTAAIPQW